MSVGAGTKRKRAARAVYHDTVPHDDGYRTVFEKPLGNPHPSSLTTRTEADTWATTTSWAPPNDLLFALDPNGELYDTAVDADVMEEIVMEGDKSAKKSKVSVSYLHPPPDGIKFIIVCRGGRMWCGWKSIERNIFSR